MYYLHYLYYLYDVLVIKSTSKKKKNWQYTCTVNIKLRVLCNSTSYNGTKLSIVC